VKECTQIPPHLTLQPKGTYTYSVLLPLFTQFVICNPAPPPRFAVCCKIVIGIDGGAICNVVRVGEQAADMKLTTRVSSFTDKLSTQRGFSVVDICPKSAAPNKNHDI